MFVYRLRSESRADPMASIDAAMTALSSQDLSTMGPVERSLHRAQLETVRQQLELAARILLEESLSRERRPSYGHYLSELEYEPAWH